METKTYFEVLISEKESKKEIKKKRGRKKERERERILKKLADSKLQWWIRCLFFFFTLLGILNSVTQVRRNKISLVLLKIITKDSV